MGSKSRKKQKAKKGGGEVLDVNESNLYKNEIRDERFMRNSEDQWNSVLKSEDILKKQSEAERLIKDAQGQLEENKPLMEQIRKWSEAYKKVVDYKG